jgi:hypothetical protein
MEAFMPGSALIIDGGCLNRRERLERDRQAAVDDQGFAGHVGTSIRG